MNTLVHLMRVLEHEGPTFNGSFPDLPGPTVMATDLATLVVRGREALLAELQRLEGAGLDWPEPRAIDELRGHSGEANGLLLMIEIEVDDTPIRVNISLPERLLKRLDAAAHSADMTRSGYVAAAVRTRMDQEAQAHAEGPMLKVLYEELSRVGVRLNDTFGPASDFGRVVSELDQRALEGLRALTARVVGTKDTDPSS